MPEQNSRKRKIIRIFVILVIIGLAVEIGLRMLGGAEGIFARYGGGRDNMQLLLSIMTGDQVRGFKLRPGASGKMMVQGREVEINVDRDGFRRTIQNPRATATVLVMGDSNTFGWGVSDPETFSAQIEQMFQADATAEVEVINAGVPGYSILRTEKYYQQLVEKIKPDLLIVQLSAANHADLARADESELVRTPEVFLNLYSAFDNSTATGQITGVLGTVLKHSKVFTSREELKPRLSISHLVDSLNNIVRAERGAGRKMIVLSIFAPPDVRAPDNFGKYQDEIEGWFERTGKAFKIPVFTTGELFDARTWKTSADDAHAAASTHEVIARKIFPDVKKLLVKNRRLTP